MRSLAIVLAIVLSACSSSKTPPKFTHLILDTDPALGIIRDGKPRDVDDGLAISQALNSDKLYLRGITIVFGNSKLEQGYQVASELVNLKRARIPVVMGAKEAMGEGKPKITRAVKFMAHELKKMKITIAAIGPLTNIASLIKNFPEEAKNIEKIVVVMGRSPDQHFYIGDHGPVRDFNYVKDAKAAQIVAKSGIPMALAPFELSSQALITPEHLMQIKKRGTKSAEYLFEKSQNWLQFWYKNFPGEHGFHPWDSAALTYLTHKHLLNCEMRGYRFREVADKAHGTGKKDTGKKAKMQPWFELGKDFKTNQLEYCYSFKENQKHVFLDQIVKRIY